MESVVRCVLALACYEHAEPTIEMVLVVPLGKNAKTGGVSTRDLALRHQFYAHPVGKGRLKKVPNYVAFTFDGSLRAIHHVESAEYTTGPSTLLKRFGIAFDKPHFVFKLGEAFAPAHKVTAHVQNKQWCLLDTLFTCKTLGEAQAVKTKRLKHQFGDIEDEES